ncbi:MAG: ABC transporter ATP-binding protein [Candidatus Rokuibacteriota bacterium]
MILRLERVDTFYGLVHMLHGITLAVAPGECVTLLGRNGAGKTTVIKTVMGLVPPRQGKVIFKGADITGLPPHVVARRGIAYVPASRGIFSALTAQENLDIAHVRGAPWTPELVFERFPKLSALRRRRGRVLSGGEQQMLAIGRALVTHPALILLDEPSQGLAPLVVDAVLEMLHELRREGTSLVLVEQNVPMALALADRVYILDQGAIVYAGPTAEFAADERVALRYLGVGVT